MKASIISRSSEASENAPAKSAAAAHTGEDRLLSTLLSAVPLPLFHTWLGTPIVIPYYHMVSDERVPHVDHLYSYRDIRQFARTIDFFLSHYQPLGLKDLLEHLAGRKALPKRCFLLTFDDGFREMHDVVAPILKAKGVPATFFLTTGFIDNLDLAHHCKLSLLIEHISRAPGDGLQEKVRDFLTRAGVNADSLEAQLLSLRYRQRHLVTELAALCEYDFDQYRAFCRPYLTSDQVRSLLKQGFTIGAHSVDHPLYADLPLAEQVRQTSESVQFLVKRFQIDYRAFAFPHSDVGVTPEFFETLFANGQLSVSFGTRGMVRHFFARNFERFSMEKTSLPARRVVAKHYARGLLRKFA